MVKYCCELFKACCELNHFKNDDGRGGWWMVLHGDYNKNSMPDIWPFTYCPFCATKLVDNINQ